MARLKDLISNAYAKLKTAAVAFNCWRKKYWLTRLIILLLIFSFPIYERLSGNFVIIDLVKIAIQSVLNDAESKLAAARIRYYRICEAQQLRALLKAYFDRNGNGTVDESESELLSQNGFDPKEIDKKALYSNAGIRNMWKLTAIAKHFRLLPGAYSVKRVVREAFYAGFAETEQESSLIKKEIYNDLARMASWPDYSKWTTWKSGIELFEYSIWSILIAWAPIYTTAAWLMICFNISIFISRIFPSKFGKISAALIPFLITLLFVTWGQQALIKIFWMPAIYIKVSLLLLVAAVSLKGAGFHHNGDDLKTSAYSFFNSVSVIIFFWGCFGVFSTTVSWGKWGYLISCIFGRVGGNLIWDNLEMEIWQYLLICFMAIVILSLNLYRKERNKNL